MPQKNYKAAISAILADPTTSAWLRDRIQEMEKRDPIDAATDAVVLSKLAELRMTDVFGIQYSTRVYLEQPQEPENRPQRPCMLIEQNGSRLSGRLPIAPFKLLHDLFALLGVGDLQVQHHAAGIPILDHAAGTDA